jgi:co-chaperonin GroES (HSP10)
MKIRPLNNMVYAEILKDEALTSSIDVVVGVENFIRVKILAVGSKVDGIKVGDIIYANPRFETINRLKPNLGFLNSVDILAVIE